MCGGALAVKAVCMCVYAQACAHAMMHACRNGFMPSYTPACVHACANVYVCGVDGRAHVCVGVTVRPAACMHACMHACMDACVHAGLST